MTGKRNIVSVAAIGVLSAALTLLAGPPAAQSDELADLRANQELLQKRLDQLSQAPPAAPLIQAVEFRAPVPLSAPPSPR